MRRARGVEVGGAEVEVRELTVAEIAAWLAGAAAAEGDAAGAAGDLTAAPAGSDLAARLLCGEDFSPDDLRLFSPGLSDELLGLATPGELRQLWAAAQDLNRDFFAMRQRLAALTLPTLPQTRMQHSAERPAASCDTGTLASGATPTGCI